MSKLNLKIPPVALGLIASILMLLLNRWLPLYRIDFKLQAGLSVCIICLGAWVALLAVIAFVRSGTTVDPRHPDQARQLVRMGIYRYSRNPMYLGILLILLGISSSIIFLSPRT
jgi:protein-S-isoprenylcysteine O-methyltransferase Ste14